MIAFHLPQGILKDALVESVCSSQALDLQWMIDNLSLVQSC